MPLVVNEEKPDEKPKERRMDRTLALCNRLDREFEKLPEWGRKLVCDYLSSKWQAKQ